MVMILLFSMATEVTTHSPSQTPQETWNKFNYCQWHRRVDLITTVETLKFNDIEVTEAVAPIFQSAATSNDGRRVILTYDEVLSSITATTSAFTVTTDGAINAVTAVAISDFTVELTVENTIKNDQTVNVTYNDPSPTIDSSNVVQDNQGNDAANLNSASVNNSSTITGTPPTISLTQTSQL